MTSLESLHHELFDSRQVSANDEARANSRPAISQTQTTLSSANAEPWATSPPRAAIWKRFFGDPRANGKLASYARSLVMDASKNFRES